MPETNKLSIKKADLLKIIETDIVQKTEDKVAHLKSLDPDTLNQEQYYRLNYGLPSFDTAKLRKVATIIRDWEPPFPFKSVLQELSSLFSFEPEDAPVPKDGKDVQVMAISQEEANHNLTIDAVDWAVQQFLKSMPDEATVE